MPDVSCTPSVSHVVHRQRSVGGSPAYIVDLEEATMGWVLGLITSLASGSSRWRPNEVVVRGPRHTPPPPPPIA